MKQIPHTEMLKKSCKFNHKDTGYKPRLCPICKNKLTEHSELQDKICNMIIIKQFANNCPGFDVQFRPFFKKEEEED
jgi:hypothetical protein